MSRVSEISNRFLRAVSLVVTDRRWAAPLSAMALGFGLFIGVAIGPNAAGTLAGVTPIVELPSFDRGTSDDGDGGGGGGLASPAGPSVGGEGGGGLGTLPAPVPIEPPPIEPAPAAKKPPPARVPVEEEEEGEETQDFRGVVVHANPAAGSYALAIEGGELISIHAAELPVPGTKLSLSARRLANNTFAEVEAGKPQGSVKRATFRGAVTFVDADQAAPAYTLSGRGTSILVHVRPDPAGAVPQLPPLGSYVTVTVDIEAKPAASAASAAPPDSQPPSATAPLHASTTTPPSACAPDLSLPGLKPFAPAAALWQSEIEVEGEPSTYIDLAGIVTALCPDRLVVSADGSRESEADLELAVPAAIETSKLRIGDSIVATATIESDGTFTLAGLAGDERAKGAEDASFAQGDLKR